MSRSITIQATYLNGIKVTRGIFSPVNAEYFKSLLSYNDLNTALNRFKKETKGKKYKNLKITHNISTGNSSDGWIYFEFHNPQLNMREMIKQTEMNKCAFEPYLN